MTAVTVPVLLDDWQIECCGDPPGLGDRVSWHLDWSSYLADVLPSDFALAARVDRLEALPAAAGEVPGVARVGDLVVFVTVPGDAGEFVLRGVLHEEHHGGVPEEVPRTLGVVRRVRLVSWEYTETAWRTLERVPESVELTDVERAPTWFHSPDDPGGRRVTGVLVDLEVRPWRR